MIGGSADAVQEPNAKVGQKTYCPVSGVVFQISDASIRRGIGGRNVYFCCEGCAGYFDANRELVMKARSPRVN